MNNSIVRQERFGRFTVVELKGKNGLMAVGIARRGYNDPNSDTIGLQVAVGRAERALEVKSSHKNKKLHRYQS